MRRARMALSRDVGMRFVDSEDSEEDGLMTICSGEGDSIGRVELLVSWRRVLKSKAPKGDFDRYIVREVKAITLESLVQRYDRNREIDANIFK